MYYYDISNVLLIPNALQLRAPQPAVYLYCLDVSRAALDSGLYTLVEPEL